MSQRKRGPKVGSSQKPSLSKAKLNDVVSSIVDSADSYTLPEDLEHVRTLVVDFALHIHSLEAELKYVYSDTKANPCGMGSTDPGDVDSDGDDDPDTLVVRFEDLSLKRHYGNSSTHQFLQSALDIKSQLTGEHKPIITFDKRPQFWEIPQWQAYPEFNYPPFVFPEDDLIHNLIDLYFSKINPYFPMLYRKAVEKSVSERLHHGNKGFGALLLMLCSLASQHSDDPRTLFEGTVSEHSKGWKYFRQIQLVRPGFEEPPSIYEFQLYALASLYLHTTNVSGASYSYFLISLGIRVAQQRGVHKREFAVQGNPIETELWRRAFWCLIVFDIYGSTTLGRPRATTTEDFDVEFPQECDDDEFWETADLGKHSMLSFWIHYLKLIDIIGFAHRSLYSVKSSPSEPGGDISSRSDWNRKAVIEIDAALNKWVDSIPEHLKWNPQCAHEIFFHESVMLYSTYFWAQIFVHKYFIPRPGQSEVHATFPSLTICVNSARSVIGVLEVHIRRHPFVPQPLLIGVYFDSAVVILMNLWRGMRTLVVSDPRKEMEDVDRCIRMLTAYEKRYQIAGRLCDILNSVITLDQSSVRSLQRTKTSAKPSLVSSDELAPHHMEIGSQRVGMSSQERSEPQLEESRDHLDDDPFILPYLYGSHALDTVELGTLPLSSSCDHTAGQLSPLRSLRRAITPAKPSLVSSDDASALEHLEPGSHRVGLSSQDCSGPSLAHLGSGDPSNLPYHSYELGTLPLHSSSRACDTSDYSDFVANPLDPIFFDGVDPLQQEDWNSFMNLLQSVDDTGFGTGFG
ncbi:hypothetical protein BT96DRAFT_925780 [Gymnopus androsaceus JB14]|uniref:Xylanolytic transcriptional activator regulatory domain-containing protein n=1 Tax=Gymnopus androsaceus JB14 TaxID=1447944 RepID=A0A6A4GXX5_9AGAR|nr:hypothetical protein BT96DRAFT_925780 [Gymnopus androsaceus JB14]